MTRSILVTGAAGYIGVPVCEVLSGYGHRVRGLDAFIHGQTDVRSQLEQIGVEVIEADIRDSAARQRALAGTEIVVHLAAIVGDPACARDPQLSHEVNVEGSRALARDAHEAGVERLVFASTCSNYGRVADPTIAVDETAPLAPVSLYAEQKVGFERGLLAGEFGDVQPTCLRFATVYGVAPRMRFDLTLNEFTLVLWSERVLEVFGEQFWRPYIHVRDAARAVAAAVGAPLSTVGGEVFNAGASDQNYRKIDLVGEIRRHVQSGDVRYVQRDEDPRDYKVDFAKIRSVLGFETEMHVPGGIVEVTEALSASRFGDPFGPRYRNTP
jgi:nucleoside-diphosphate-sugar epimerase